MGHESNGLGLSISKRISECLGGDLVYVHQYFGCRFDLKLRVKVVEQNIFNTKALNFIEANDSQMNVAESIFELSNTQQAKAELTSILVAEDSKICHDVIRAQFEQLKIVHKCAFFYTGDRVLDYAIKMYEDHPEHPQPVKLMLLDNHMPRLMGILVVQKVREYIKKQNTTREVKIKEPMFVIVSAYINTNLRAYLREWDIHHAYDKPLQPEETVQLLKQAHVDQ